MDIKELLRRVGLFDGLAENVIELCQKPDERLRLGAAARTFAVEHYDLSKICLPGQLRWLGRSSLS